MLLRRVNDNRVSKVINITQKFLNLQRNVGTAARGTCQDFADLEIIDARCAINLVIKNQFAGLEKI